ncbi:MAG: hypothetical protein VB127_11615, partial [Sphaerochaeta sp.]|nr:hypothetical protein [Sphaerochaeta sp.]
MKTSESWDLCSIGDISSDKAQKNLREISIFLANNIRTIQSIAFQYHPLELVKYALWEQRRVASTKKSDTFSLQVSASLVRYLADLLLFWEKDHSQNRDIKQKDWKRLYQVYEDICKKSVRFVDNQALLLRSQGFLQEEALLLAYQDEACTYVLPSVVDGSLLEQKYTALRYQLQPFNALVGEVFPAKLDGLLSSLHSLARRGVEGIDTLREDSSTFKQAGLLQLELLKSRGEDVSDLNQTMDRIIKEQGWESWVDDIVGRRDGYALFDVLRDTSLSERDAYLLSCEFASLSFDGASHVLTESSMRREKPFIRYGASYYCFDAESLLEKAYLCIKHAVCSQDEQLAQRWEAIENEKNRLVPITFFTAMLGNMHYTRNVSYENGTLDALFEDGKKELVVQVPYAVLATTLLNPFDEASSFIELLAQAHKDKNLALAHPARCVIIDTLHDTLYPLQMEEHVLMLS